MSRILIVEDDETILFALRSALGRNGYEVSAAGSLEEAKRFIQNPVDLVLLDLGLPDGEGLTLLKAFREAGGPPVIILTARDDEADIIKGLDAGADDYVTKPFKLGILLSRIRAALRRAVEKEEEPGREETQLLTCGDVVLDKKRTLVSVGGKETVLTAGEYRLLEILLENKNKDADAHPPAGTSVGYRRRFCQQQHAYGADQKASGKAGRGSAANHTDGERDWL